MLDIARFKPCEVLYIAVLKSIRCQHRAAAFIKDYPLLLVAPAVCAEVVKLCNDENARTTTKKLPTSVLTTALPTPLSVMSAVGSLLFCGPCGNLLDRIPGHDSVRCEHCHAVNKGASARPPACPTTTPLSC